MIQVIEANWLAFMLALLIGILVAWWLFGRGSKPVRRDRAPDVLDEGAAPAQRNQALIDAPPAFVPPPASNGMVGMGDTVAAGAPDVVESADVAAPPPAAPVAAPAAGQADDLKRIKGVGPKLSALLASLGVTSYAQIAAWTEADIARIDPQLGSFQGRIVRDNWVEQCRLLAAGDTSGFEGRFGKL
jgi:predicted flap endonuclease-1-like 5' DNA nuclease